ncbi:hypothetical protein PIROE2DRAFT_63901 [Piromyces sp. E2]|nr:hypothetical protein PIROE2DRAFT_63901 [Piromyces sp. E2]|eukprot:OUM59245.1 hypothetical protein PIROE2DRAFT_63901 [Piromyces sp. E2]
MEKKKKEEEKEEKKKHKEEEKKLKDEEKKKEKEEKKKEKEEKKMKDKDKNSKIKPLKDSEIDEEVSGSNGFLHKFLHKNSSKEKLGSIDSICNDKEGSGDKLDKSKSRSQNQFLNNKNKDRDVCSSKGCIITESSSNVNSIINLLENNKFGSSNNNNNNNNPSNHTNGSDSVHSSHDSLASDENLCKNKVKKNIKLFNHKKFNTTVEPYDSTSNSNKEIQNIKPSSSFDHVLKEKNDENYIRSMVNDQSTSSNNGLLVTKKVAAPPKRRPPTKKKLLEDAETAYTQRTGNDFSKDGIHSSDNSVTDFNSNNEITSKLPSFHSLKDNNNNNKSNLSETSNKEINIMNDDNDDDNDDDEELFDDGLDKNSLEENILDLKKKLTKKLINKQKFSDKLYPGGENCDSNIGKDTKEIFFDQPNIYIYI